MRRLITGVLLAVPACALGQLPGNEPLPAFAHLTDGDTWLCESDGDRLYVAGRFTAIGPYTGSFTSVDASGEALPMPATDGNVYAVASDGEGGWYIGGDFTRVGESDRDNLAHFNADGELTDWAPSVGGEVLDLAVSDTVVVVAGDFGSIGGQPRENLATVNRATGNPTLFAPEPDHVVTAVAIVDDVVYAIGYFSEMNGQPRNGLAAMESFLGNLLPLDPITSGAPNAILIEGDTMYVAGHLSVNEDPATRHVVSIDRLTGKADGVVDVVFSDGIHGSVFALAAAGSDLYVGGRFTVMAGEPREHACVIDRTDGTLGDWAPSLAYPPYHNNTPRVWAMTTDQTCVYLGGEFLLADGEPRPLVAAYDRETGELSSWSPSPSGGPEVRDIVAAGDQVGFGGRFEVVGRPAPGLGSLDQSTGEDTGWMPDLHFEKLFRVSVLSMTHHEGIVYCGGIADLFDGPDDTFFVALDARTGEVISDFEPLFDEGYTPFDGDMTIVDGVLVARLRNFVDAVEDLLVGIDTTSHELLWVIDIQGSVRALHPGAAAGQVLVAGRFDELGDVVAREAMGVAAVDASTGIATFWDLPVNEAIRAMALDGTTLFVGGEFTDLAGVPRTRLAAIDLSDPVLPVVADWNPGLVDDDVTTLAVVGDALIAGGDFDQIDGVHRPRLAALSVKTASVCDWDPQANIAPSDIDVQVDRMHLAVDLFQKFAGVPRPRLAAFEVAVCDADFNHDCALNILDFVSFQSAFMAGDAAADCNADGQFSILDFVCFQLAFQAGCP